MPSITMTCPGVCKGDPNWRAENGLGCSCCGGTGKVTIHNEREHAAEEWDAIQAARRERAERRGWPL